MEQSRAKLNIEAKVDSVPPVIVDDKANSSPSTCGEQVVVGAMKIDTSESVKTSALEAKPESNSSLSSTLKSPSSTSSSGAPSKVPSIISGNINENNNAENLLSVKTNVEQNIPTDLEKVSALQAIDEDNICGNGIDSSINVISDDKSYNYGSISDNNSKNNSKSSLGDCSQKDDNLCSPETRNNSECVKLSQDTDLSSRMAVINLDDMELVNLEDEEHGDSIMQYEGQKELKNIMSHSKSDSDLSSEERRAELYRQRLHSGIQNLNMNQNSTAKSNKSFMHSSESFNDFHYWREPMASLEIEDSNASSTSEDRPELKINEDSALEQRSCSIKEITETDLDDEIDDQLVLASLTGMNTRTNSDEKKLGSNSPFDLEDLDDDIIQHDKQLDKVDMVDLKPSNTSKSEGREYKDELLTDSTKHLDVENSSTDKNSMVALSEQTDISSQSSELIAETEYFLSNVKSEIPTSQDSPIPSKGASLSKGKFNMDMYLNTT